MRPRHNAGENLVDRLAVPTGTLASMRPRHNAGENVRAGGDCHEGGRLLQ